MAVKKKKVITMQEYIQKNDIKPTYNLTDIAPVKKTTSFYGSPTIVEDLGNLISVSKNEDFKENSGYVSTKSDKFLEKLGSKYGMGYTDLQYEYINNQNDIRDEIDRKAVTWSSDTGDKSVSFKDEALEYMTKEEVGVYNYYYKTEGKEKAQKFLDTLAETLSNRKAGVEFEDIQGKTAREILYGTVSGTEQFKQGIKNVGNMVVGKDDYIPQTSEQVLSTMIRKDLEDDGTKVFGNSLGQVGYDMLTTGANMIPAMATGNPLLGALTMGASATGNAYQQDLNETGDKEKAKIYATTVGALEGTLQYLIGGIGKLGGTSAYINNAVSGVKNGALRFALEYGGKIGSEALEEGLQEIIDPVVKNAVHGTDEEVDWENVVYSALMGGLMGGVFGASEVASTHLNSNEYSVVEKEIENRIKAKETDDKKLTKRDKNKIREQVMSDLEKGRIDTDEIGKMFAEESYNEYMESVKKEEAELEKPKAKLNELKDELKSLKAEREKLRGFPNVQKAVDKTIKRTDGKILTLEKQIESIKNNSGRLQLQNKMDAEAFEKLKGTRLAESYHEKARRGQAIEVDIESYDNERARKTAQNFINYGANNSNASHDFLDLTTKLAKEGKYSYMFMTSKQLEESVKKGNPYGITEDASKVEAFVNENTKEIVIIMDANKSLSSLVGHEVTHTLESATLYEGVKSIAINLAKMRGEYDGRWESIQRRYKDYTEEEQMQELVSDLIGDYLFGDTEFIKNLSTENPNAFQKIYNEIKHILKLATAGSKEARELERLKKEFEKVWRENGSSSSNGIRYRLSVPQGFTTLSEYEKIWSNYNVPKEFKSAIIEEMDIVTEDEFAVAREEIFKEMTSNRLEEKTLVYKSFVFSANHVFYYDNYSETDFKVTKVVSIEPEYSIEIDEVFYEGIIKRYGEKISDRNKELGYVKESGVSSSSHDGYSEASRGNVGVFEEGTAEGQPSIIPEDGRNTRLNEVAPIDENAKTSSEDGVFFDAKKDSDTNIKTEVNDFYNDEMFATMSYTQDGKVVGTLEYSEYEGEPNVKMIEVSPEYRRKGIGKKLLQELQRNYPDVEINFGMTTPDGTKLLDSITYTQIDKKVAEGKQKLNALQTELSNVEERLNELYDLEELTTEQQEEVERLGDRWDELYYTEIPNMIEEYGNKKESRRFIRTRISDDDSYNSKEYGNHIYAKDVNVEETALAPTEESKVAQILDKAPIIERDEDGVFDVFMEKLVDKGYVFEKLSKKTKNRELEAKYNSIRYADRMAQDFIGNGKGDVKALNDIAKDVESKGIQEDLDSYMYHLHNIDRMSLSSRFGIDNKAVYGNKVTADVSRKAVAEMEAKHPEFKKYAEDIYKINNHLRNMLVEGGVISQETANLWQEMYPHYVPIKRVNSKGANVNVPLQTGRTGINAPIKRATGGSADIEPLLTTMADRVLQTYKAVAKNKFGIELKNTLNSVVEKQKVDMDNVLDGMEQHEELLQEGKNGQKPTFTVFENGERVTFEVDQLMYEALKPTDRHLAKTYKIPNAIANFHRNVVTQYNPSFMIRNPIKDTQDVLINSQHPLKTYKNFPKAIDEIIRNGKWHQEYVSNGGEYNTYYERDSKKFAEEKSKISKVIGFPLDKISAVNEAVEKLPRLAEYIASREEGRSIEVSMLDSARVTTNFSAGADITKFANRNGATFLNASVQGAMQTYRNFTEAKMDGAKGWVKLATKFAVAGLPVVFLNNMIWDDDEEYDELSDYVKQNYYIVAKFGDGEFVRIPKGRTLAVIQNGFEQISNALTGDGEVDLEAFAELVVSNLAPNNPYENNILAPIRQVRNNETWYGEDLVPSRLQDIPDAEQYDESIDTFSKWLGEKIDYSPYKINYLIDQYSGAIGDTFLPMLTPEAESGDDKLLGKMTAPLRSAFTTDSVLNNQTISDFYDTSDELTINANKSSATDEEILSSKYFNSVKSEIGKLYGEKREVQNKELKDSEKYNLNRDIQKKINSMSKEALESYDDVYIKGDYATVGDKQYRRTKDGWTKLSEDQIAKQNEVTSGLDIAPDKYWSDKEEYDYAYENPEKYAIAKSVGGYDNFSKYNKVLNSFHNDETKTAKEKKTEYIFDLDIDYGQQAILYRSCYKKEADKKKYDADIKEYLYSRDDISYEDMLTILEWLEIK